MLINENLKKKNTDEILESSRKYLKITKFNHFCQEF